MKNIFISTVVLFSILSIDCTVYADARQPSPICNKPYKPYKFSSKYDLENFQDEVDRYKRCIKAFISEQEYQIKKHNDAIDSVTDEWNNFVAFELK